MSDVEIRTSVLWPTRMLKAAEWNPNVESDPMFTQLVEQIRQIGFTEPLLIVEQDSGYGLILAGEHRWRAAEVLGMTEVPVVVLDMDDEDQQKALTLRHNVVRGRIDPALFTRTFNQLANKYGPDVVRRMVGTVEDSTFRRLYRDVRAGLPREVRKKLDATKNELSTVDDLARTLQRIMAEADGTQDLSFVVFTLKQEHMMVRASDRTWRNLKRIAAECEEEKVDINLRLNQLLEAYVPF